MEDAARTADRALAIRVVASPGIHFYRALANFALRRYDVAEKSARQAVELDAAREIPQAEHLLGDVLAAQGDRRGAVQHLSKYLEIAPKAQDAEKVRQRIAQLENGP